MILEMRRHKPISYKMSKKLTVTCLPVCLIVRFISFLTLISYSEDYTNVPCGIAAAFTVTD